MIRWLFRLFVFAVGVLVWPQRCAAPLIYTPGEGWRYEQVGEGSWQRARAKDQLEVAQTAFDKKDYGLAEKAARRTVKVWPFSDYAPQAQYILARCCEAGGNDEKAFNAYQKLIETYPKDANFDEIIQRQFGIANRFLGRQRFKLFGYLPWFPSMDKTIKMYEKIIKNGRYSAVAPQAQMNIGAAHENKRALGFRVPDYPQAAKAYEVAADRYSEQQAGMDALFKAGLTYQKQAKTAEYDQSIAGQAIATFTDFNTLHPEDPRRAEAEKIIDALKTEQARGSFNVARYYEKRGKWKAALIYYSEVINILLKNPDSDYAVKARYRIDAISREHQE
jgi:outer membrane protein assembly factor BamD (BamD/ComL family)